MLGCSEFFVDINSRIDRQIENNDTYTRFIVFGLSPKLFIKSGDEYEEVLWKAVVYEKKPIKVLVKTGRIKNKIEPNMFEIEVDLNSALNGKMRRSDYFTHVEVMCKSKMK